MPRTVAALATLSMTRFALVGLARSNEVCVRAGTRSHRELENVGHSDGSGETHLAVIAVFE